MNLIWDIEANGFTRQATEIWMSVFLDADTQEVHVFTDHDDDYPSIKDSIKLMDEATSIIGHNIMRYDVPVFERITGYIFDRHKLVDTMIYSKLNDFKRPRAGFRHSLKALAKQAGEEQKQDYSGGFDAYSADMLSYCIDDVKANLSVYNMLMKEYDIISEGNPKYDDAIKLEHQMSYWSSKQVANGWAIDEALLDETISKIRTEMTEIEEHIEPKLGTMEITIDKEPKTPKYKKNGEYTAVSARVIGEFLGQYVDPSDALKEEPPMAPDTEFQRKEIVDARLGNQEHVKEFLLEMGWTPDDWNWKKINNVFTKVSAKLTSTSLTKLGAVGDGIDRYYTLRARHSILKGWLDNIEDGRIYGDVIDIGAATGRQTHKIVANIPSPKAAYGSDIRRMFIAPEGKTLISADGASYQARVMAHFAKDEEFSHEILDGDIHQKNADAVGCSRALAKPFFFAWAFGAGGAKLGRILGVSAQQGNKRKQAFLDRWPALKELTENVVNVANGRKFLRGLDGRRIQTDEGYKAFNYLIQGTEGILMKRTIVRINEAFEKAGIDAKQLLFYHDEVTFEIDPKDAKEAEDIIRYWFAEAPKELDVNNMEAGDCKIGQDYLEVH